MRSRGPLQRSEGRRLFGADLTAYERARPPYPERVYQVLRERCGLGPGSRVLEIGPGTGAVTRRVLEADPERIVAVEPDERLAAHLARTVAGRAVDVVATAFEDWQVAAGGFDLAIAATSFHWVQQRLGLRKVAAALRPGGWWAMWWTVFGDPSRPDPFRDATDALLRPLPSGPSAAGVGGSFALDVEARLADLRGAGGFDRVEHERLAWEARLDAAQARALYATFASIARLPGDERRRLLDELERIAAADFGGRVERPCVTALYTAERSQ